MKTSVLGPTAIATKRLIELISLYIDHISVREAHLSDARAELAAREQFLDSASEADWMLEFAKHRVAKTNAKNAEWYATTYRELLEDGVQVMCGAVLQQAKQILSRIHGHPAEWPTGRLVGNQALSKVVLEARNQSMHFEEGSYRTPVLNVFQQLELEFGAQFHLDNSVRLSRAKEVVELLGWTTYQNYEKDMLQLLKQPA